VLLFAPLSDVGAFADTAATAVIEPISKSYGATMELVFAAVAVGGIVHTTEYIFESPKAVAAKMKTKRMFILLCTCSYSI